VADVRLIADRVVIMMKLSNAKQEQYRRRYGQVRPSWRPSTHVYEDLVAKRLSEALSTLDLGSGRGGVMERLHMAASFATGLDPDWASLRMHRATGLSLACGLGETLPYADNTFDSVCCSWVLEHLEKPRRTFAEVARVLRSGGSFVFLTPNVRHPLLLLNRALGWTRGRVVRRFYDRDHPDIFPALYRANSAIQIRRLASAVGMELASLRFVGDPTYLAFNDHLFRFGCALETVTPRWMRVHLVGECVLPE